MADNIKRKIRRRQTGIIHKRRQASGLTNPSHLETPPCTKSARYKRTIAGPRTEELKSDIDFREQLEEEPYIPPEPEHVRQYWIGELFDDYTFGHGWSLS